MIWLYLLTFLLLSVGIVLVIGLTPEMITDDLMTILVPEQGLRDKALTAQGKKKSHRITVEILHIKEALTATGKANQFTLTCAASVVLMLVGCIVSVLLGNYFLIPVAAAVFSSIPFLSASKTIHDYDKLMREELETALSIVTTSYIRTDDIVNAVRENLIYLKPPVHDIFTAFVSDAL